MSGLNRDHGRHWKCDMADSQTVTAQVFKQDRLAATLHKSRDGVTFAYLPEYVESGNPPIAISLPVTAEPMFFPGGAVPPFFAGMLPEGRRLSVLRRALKTSADDEFGLLLAVGGDLVGDVTVRPFGEAEDPAPTLELPDDLSTVSVTELLRGVSYDPVGIPGVQEKFSGRMISAPGLQGTDSLIVKLDPPEYPSVVRNEAAFLKLARMAGLVTPEWRLDVDADGTDVLCISRFDRGSGGAKRALEDATQVLGIWPADKYNVSAEEIVSVLAEHCTARAVALKTLFEQVMFAVITGNGDQHAKNLSILAEPGSEEFRVSPAYDVPSTVVYGDLTYALPIVGTESGLSRKGALRFAEAVGLPERAAVRSLDRLLTNTAGPLADVGALKLPYAESKLRQWQRELDYRRRQLA